MSEMDSDSWSIVKKFLIVKCKCCDEMISSDNFKCAYCKKFFCFDADEYIVTQDEETWEEKHMCHWCQIEYADSKFRGREPKYTGDHKPKHFH